MSVVLVQDDIKLRVSEILRRVDKLVKKGDLHLAMRETERALEIDPRNIYAHAYRERITILLQKGEQRIPGARSPNQHQKPRPIELTRDRAQSVYLNVLRQIWADGAATADEEGMLKVLRSGLGITAEQHFLLEATVKRECYLNAFKQFWSSPVITPDSEANLSDLRRRYGIAAEEVESIELELLQEICERGMGE